jgi:hypothetical protein
VDLYVRGYWLTRYLDETQPGLLKDFLSKRYQYDEFEREIATAAGKGLEGFWGEIDEVLVSHFNQKGDTS